VTDSPFDRLVRLLPPPLGEVTGVPWQLSRPEIGVDFPTDFREFTDHYGGGDVVRPNGRVSLSVFGLCGCERPGGAAGGFPAFMANQTEEIYPLFVFDGADEDYWGARSIRSSRIPVACWLGARMWTETSSSG